MRRATLPGAAHTISTAASASSPSASCGAVYERDREDEPVSPACFRRWPDGGSAPYVGPEAGMEEGGVCDQAETADEVLGFPLVDVHELLEEGRHCGFAVTGWV